MPNEAEPKEGTWVSIADFTPGCYSSGGAVTGNTSDRMLAAPIGAADAIHTWSCYALPNKSLAALPGVTKTYTWPDTSATGYNMGPGIGGNTSTYVVGVLVHDELGNGDTEAILIGEFDNGTNHYWQAYSYVLETSTLNSIVSTTNTSALGIFGSPYPQFTRVANAFLISGFTSGATTVFTTSYSGAANPFAVGDTFYLDQIPPNLAGLMLNTPYLVTAIGGSSGAWTFTISTPTTTGSFVSDGGATILQIPYGPVAVFPSGGQAQAAQGGTADGQLYMYPNPAARSVFGAFAMMANPGGSVTGQTIVHQSRVIVLAGVTYPYPAGGGFDTNENLNFTDPPLSASMGDQQTVLAAEEPYGYGGAGSISAGELFLVKKRGGGVILTGDIVTDPSVTLLPGVTSTGNFYGQGASTPTGFVYAAEDNGMWAWNGSNTSQKLSTNLDDTFFLPPEFSAIASNNYGYYAAEYGSRIYASSNWMLDLNNGAWWTYYPRGAVGTIGGITGHDLFWVQPVNGNYIYAAQLSFIGSSSLDFMYRFDPATAAQYYQWQSLPLRLVDPDHRSDIREVVVRASCQTVGCTIALTIFDQEVIVWGTDTNSFTVSDGPQMLRFNTAGIGTTAPAFRIGVTGTGSGDMPIIHSIDIRYKTRAHQAVGN